MIITDPEDHRKFVERVRKRRGLSTESNNGLNPCGEIVLEDTKMSKMDENVLLEEVKRIFLTVPAEDFEDYINECTAEYGQPVMDRVLIQLEEQIRGVN